MLSALADARALGTQRKEARADAVSEFLLEGGVSMMKAPPNTSQTPAARLLSPTQALTVSYHLLQEECTDEKGTGSLGKRRNKKPTNPHRGPGARGKAELLDSLRAAELAPPASWGLCTVVMNGLWVLTGKRGLLRKLRPTF